MAESTVWWLVAGAAVAIELATGTFYLLMLAAGLAAGAIAAHLGASLTVQLLVAAVVSSATVGAWHGSRSRRPKDAPAEANRDVNLDIGETVHVEAWNTDGSASVKYRGANWTVLLAPGGIAAQGPYKVREVTGNRLIVEKL
jgi:membrane protein implicated in regulation of membrane protease activity